MTFDCYGNQWEDVQMECKDLHNAHSFCRECHNTTIYFDNNPFLCFSYKGAWQIIRRYDDRFGVEESVQIIPGEQKHVGEKHQWNVALMFNICNQLVFIMNRFLPTTFACDEIIY